MIKIITKTWGGRVSNYEKMGSQGKPDIASSWGDSLLSSTKSRGCREITKKWGWQSLKLQKDRVTGKARHCK